MSIRDFLISYHGYLLIPVFIGFGIGAFLHRASVARLGESDAKRLTEMKGRNKNHWRFLPCAVIAPFLGFTYGLLLLASVSALLVSVGHYRVMKMELPKAFKTESTKVLVVTLCTGVTLYLALWGALSRAY